VWTLDADLAGAFDKISHEHLLGMLGGFPARDMIAGWLKAGISRRKRVRADRGRNSSGRYYFAFAVDIALHGLEEAAGVRYHTGLLRSGKAGLPVLTRYADDLVVCCYSRQQAEQVKASCRWLEPRGCVQ